jgi:hypothetical protein
MPEPTADLTPAPSYFDVVEPTWTHADGRRFWRLTETVQVTIHPDGRIGIIDSTRPTFRVLNRPGRKGTEVYLFPRPDAA